MKNWGIEELVNWSIEELVNIRIGEYKNWGIEELVNWNIGLKTEAEAEQSKET
ncbi:hypothetical protein [Sandaracinomonas limnophila]|uniref:hypothetical protein n=1 Tax=Sandaracinomonas limnophila TaxID=1862386 RepID=UPI001EEE96F2|nr:hypothetical protein [Sandaracinomonas limnophila]